MPIVSGSTKNGLGAWSSLLLLVVAVACQNSTATTSQQGQPKTGGSVTVILGSEPDSLDPAQAALGNSCLVMDDIFDTLIVLDPTSRDYKAGLATSWTTNSDASSYTFKLRAGVKFQDGTPFNADAVKYSFDRLKDPALKSPIALGDLGPYQQTEVLDSLTAKVDFSKPYPIFPENVSQCWLAPVSPTAAAKSGTNFGRNPVGTGPYKFQEWVANDHVTITRNPDYDWPPAVVAQHSGPGYADQFVFKSIGDAGARTAALESGGAPIVAGVPEADFVRLKSAGQFQMVRAGLAGAPYNLFMNTERPPTDDINVRQAILYALNRQDVCITSAFGVDPAATGVLSPTTPGYVDLSQMYPYDLNKAKQLLDGAGWKVGTDGIRVKNGQRLTLLYNTIDAFKQLAVPIQGYLKTVGIEVTLQIQDIPTSFAFDSKGLGNLSLTGFIDSSASGTLDFFYNSKNYGGFDWARVKDSTLDSLLSSSQSELDPVKRQAALAQLQTRIAAQAYSFGMCDIEFLYGLDSKKVGGFHTNVLAYPYFYDVYTK
jgi:peptide/nickel transport system substrate-binding protein